MANQGSEQVVKLLLLVGTLHSSQSHMQQQPPLLLFEMMPSRVGSRLDQ